MTFSSVVLPQPLGPRMTMVLPSGTVRLRSRMENVAWGPPRAWSLSVLLTLIRSIRATTESPTRSCPLFLDGVRQLRRREHTRILDIDSQMLGRLWRGGHQAHPLGCVEAVPSPLRHDHGHPG